MLYIFDSTEKLITTLSEVSLFNAVHREVLNGENTFQFTISANSEHSEYVVEGNLVAFRDLDSYWQVFEIKRLVDTHSDGLTRTVYCEHIFYELLDDIVTDKRPSADATAALAGMLEGTRWQVGIVDDLGASSTTSYYISALEAVQNVANAWKGELNWRCVIQGGVITRYVDLLAMRGTDTGKQFAYSKDILSIEREVDTSEVVTALYGRGKGVETESGAYGRRLTFADVVADDKPAGQEWIGDAEALAQWGRPGGRHRFDVFTDEEETDPAVLLQKTRDELTRRKVPRATYRLDVVSLEALAGYEHEKVRLGDMVRVIDREFNPELVVSARVVELERDILDPANTKVVLGSFAPTIVEATINTARRVNYLANRPHNTAWLDGRINVLQNAIENTQSFVFQTGEDGILILDAPTYDQATKAMKLGGGIFAIANQKDGQGGWNWRTFGDGSGFTADLITAGMIDAGLVQVGPATTFAPGYDPSQIEGASAVGMGVDSDCLGLWHFDGSLNSHKGLTPTFTRASVAYLEDGTQVASGVPRFEPGKFGKAYLGEVGATNLLINPNFDTDSDWGTDATWHSTGGRDGGGYYSYGYDWGFIQDVTINKGTIYTASVYVRGNGTGRINIYNTSDSSSPGDVSVVIPNDGKWHRISVSFSVAGTGTVPIRVRLLATVGTLDFDQAQLEASSIANPFSIGTRANEVLTIPTTGILTPAQGTLSVWAYFDSSKQGDYSYLWDTDGSRFIAYKGSGGVFYMAFDGVSAFGTTYPSAGWHMVTVEWAGALVALFIDGDEVATTTLANPVAFANVTKLYLGSNYAGAEQWNNPIDELRIDRIYRTDAEIRGWYKANAPFYTSEDMKQWPGYLRAETDGLKVYDSSNALRVLLGSWLKDAIRKYGIKIIDGEIHSSNIYGSNIQSGAEGSNTYISITSDGNFRVVLNNKTILETLTNVVDGGSLYFSRNDGSRFGRIVHYNDLHPGFTIEGTNSIGSSGPLTLRGSSVTAIGNFNATGGTKNCIEDTSYGRLAISARESPEVRYIDEGMGTLVYGECRVDVDPIFMECIEPHTPDSRWYVTLAPYADVDLYVSEIGDGYFVVKERKGGTSTGAEFTWSLSATRKDYAMIRFMEVLD